MFRVPAMLLALALPAAARGATAPAGTLTLPWHAPYVTALLDGQTVRLRVNFDAAGLVALTPQAARRLGLGQEAPGLVLVGPVRVPAATRMARAVITGRPASVRLIWADRPPVEEAGIDGVISPGALPFAHVRVERAGVPRGRVTGLAARYSPTDGLVAPLDDTGITLRLAPQRADSMATAAAGALLMRKMGGRVDPAPDATRIILYGIARPVALLSLGRPLRLAGLEVRRLLVRTGDYGAVSLTRDGAADEIVVTGQSGARPRLSLTLGADQLGGCAALEWDATARRILLDCP